MKCDNRFHPFINAMLMELIYCWQSRSGELLKIETAIMIMRKHCERLKHNIFTYPFCSDEQEICFFKHVQPHFTGRLCYYTLLYEAHVSAPRNKDDAADFWMKEQQRYNRFIEKDTVDINYLRSGSCEYDRKYFLRRTNKHPQRLHSILYGLDRELFTALDALASALFAEEMYRYYVVNK
jgi:hypothetical protein